MFDKRIIANKFSSLREQLHYGQCIGPEFPPNAQALGKNLSIVIGAAKHFFVPPTELLEGRKAEEFLDLIRLPYIFSAFLFEYLHSFSVLLCADVTDTFGADEAKRNLHREHNRYRGSWAKEDRYINTWHFQQMKPDFIKSFNEQKGTNVQTSYWSFSPYSTIWNLGTVLDASTQLLCRPEDKTIWDKEATNFLLEMRLLLVLPCVMLNLHNIQTEEHAPDEKLNIRRMRSRVLPLQSFHTLIVDGERWLETPAEFLTGTGSGVRSHFRRGHPRRLDPTRVIWVRATTVHGSRPGFVEKDYTIKPPEKLPE